MWWHSPCLAALLVAAGLSLTGCNVQPLYGTTEHGSKLGEVMETVEIAPIPGRVGQKVRNELIFATRGGGPRADKALFKLDIVVKESTTNQLVKISGDATQQVLTVDATFKLSDRSGQVVLQGRATSRAAYQRNQQIFSNVRANYDAQDRAARTVAETIKVRIAAFLAHAA